MTVVLNGCYDFCNSENMDVISRKVGGGQRMMGAVCLTMRDISLQYLGANMYKDFLVKAKSSKKPNNEMANMF